MKSAQSTQLMAAPLASLFLILSLLAMRMNQRDSGGDILFETYVAGPDSAACNGDRESYFFRLHSNQTANINRNDLPVNEAYRYIASVMEHRAERAIYLSADPDASFEDVAQAIDHLKHDSPGLVFFRYGTSEKPYLEDPQNSHGCIVPINLNRLLGPPKVPSYFPPVEYQ